MEAVPAVSADVVFATRQFPSYKIGANNEIIVGKMNGQASPSDSIHLLHVGKMRIKLCKGKSTIVKENYTSSMQLCGVRGGGIGSPQAAFWQPKKGLNFILAFESDRVGMLPLCYLGGLHLTAT